MPAQQRRPLVLKLGGAALERPALAIERVRSRRRVGPLIVVVSARSGVTDALLRAVERGGSAAVRRSLRRSLARRYSRGGPQVRALLDEHGPLRSPRPVVGPVSGRAREELLALGERLSAHWLTHRLTLAGLRAEGLESDRVGLVVRGSGDGVRIDRRASSADVVAALHRCLARGVVPVLTGYFGVDGEGRVRTLGRGSSDYVASMVASIAGARGLEIVKRGGPLRRADPSILPGAPVIRRISYRAAERGVASGWTVLHPLALEPARARGIPVRVTEIESDDRGSLVSAGGPASPPLLLLVRQGREGARRSARWFRLTGPPTSELRERLQRSGPPRGVRVRSRAGALELFLSGPTSGAERRRWLARLVAGRSRHPPRRSGRRRR